MSAAPDHLPSIFQGQAVRLAPDHPPVLLIVVDTEEEFDWGAEPDRAATSVSFIDRIDLAQQVFDEYGIVPTYVVDYAVASQPRAAEPLRRIADDGRATIGAHLHPWVNPPFEESLSRRNMYPGNLDRPLETAKLRCLAERIEQSFGSRPAIYKAGRYGVGPSTARILQELGFETDVSVCPRSDFSADGGPDFSRSDCTPYWFGENSKLLEIPLTVEFVGWAKRVAEPLYRLASSPILSGLRFPGVLSRARALDRLMLSPEGFTPEEHRRLTRSLLGRGVRVFTWSFHSSSLVPGAAPYVRTESDLSGFLRLFRDYFEFFLTELGGVCLTPAALRARLEASA